MKFSQKRKFIVVTKIQLNIVPSINYSYLSVKSYSPDYPAISSVYYLYIAKWNRHAICTAECEATNNGSFVCLSYLHLFYPLQFLFKHCYFANSVCIVVSGLYEGNTFIFHVNLSILYFRVSVYNKINVIPFVSN